MREWDPASFPPYVYLSVSRTQRRRILKRSRVFADILVLADFAQKLTISLIRSVTITAIASAVPIRVIERVNLAKGLGAEDAIPADGLARIALEKDHRVTLARDANGCAAFRTGRGTLARWGGLVKSHRTSTNQLAQERE